MQNLLNSARTESSNSQYEMAGKLIIREKYFQRKNQRNLHCTTTNSTIIKQVATDPANQPAFGLAFLASNVSELCVSIEYTCPKVQFPGQTFRRSGLCVCPQIFVCGRLCLTCLRFKLRRSLLEVSVATPGGVPAPAMRDDIE